MLDGLLIKFYKGTFHVYSNMLIRSYSYSGSYPYNSPKAKGLIGKISESDAVFDDLSNHGFSENQISATVKRLSSVFLAKLLIGSYIEQLHLAI
ncbi:hypothetical protein VNO77_42866 [Canavalia gladiata]|uniref:Uncharacterized protein n=1 Tax=Canavalia gladiata TaxID=3824 RepID=A0AAN9PNY9_CANGL